MYFDINPKDDEQDFYNYREELSQLREYLSSGEKLILITGLRRVGKTSLMRVVYSKLNAPKVFLNFREYASARDMLNHAFEQIYVQMDPTRKVFDVLTSVEIGPLTLGLSADVPTIEDLDKELEKQNKRAYIFIDEGQCKDGLDDLIATYYDRTKNITFMISGSELGLIEDMFGEDRPLFGRMRKDIIMKPLPVDKSVEFLRLGFAQLGLEYKESELEDAVNKLGGLVGWLTYYGYLRKDTNHERALEILIKNARVILKAELDNFLNKQRGRKERYSLILRLLKLKPSKWNEIKEYLEFKLNKKISSARLSDYLTKLKKSGFIVEENGKYKLADPLWRVI